MLELPHPYVLLLLEPLAGHPGVGDPRVKRVRLGSVTMEHVINIGRGAETRLSAQAQFRLVDPSRTAPRAVPPVRDGSASARPASSAACSVRLDRQALGYGEDELSLLASRPIDATGGLGGVLADVLATVFAGLPHGISIEDHTTAEQRASIAAAITDLVTLMADAELTGRSPSERTGNARLLRAARALIEQRLHDPRLGPEYLARELHFSVRRLYEAFATEPVSIATLISHRRLDAIRADLDDPANAHRTVTELSEQWGFRSREHFSRAFRHRFGVSARDYRAARRVHVEELNAIAS